MKKMQIELALIVVLLFTASGQSWAAINAADYCEDMRVANGLSLQWARNCEDTIKVQEKYRRLNEADNRQKNAQERENTRRYEENGRKLDWTLETIDVDLKLRKSISTEEREKLMLRRAALCSMDFTAFLPSAVDGSAFQAEVVKSCAKIPPKPE